MHLDVGERFAQALATKDRSSLLDLFDPSVDFRAMTPGRFWEAGSATELVEVMLETWFGPDDRIERLEDLERSSVVDRDRVSYRLRVTNEGGDHLVEQHAYYEVERDRITWLRLMCSGYQPTGGATS